ncbi:MAG TPA: DUF5829 family protein [Pyrinomonadaceae bacterium]|jgi:hypothetical protein
MKMFIAAGIFIFLLTSLAIAQKRERFSFSVSLNHFFLVLDSATYADIESNQFLQTEFAIFERRTTVRTDRTYTGLYFYGINTYFEFLNVADEAQGRVGDSGIAFGVERPGALQMLHTRLLSEAPKVVTRQIDNKQVPWFFAIAPSEFPSESAISTWFMEYHPRFLSEWHPEADGSNQGIRRRQILKRYAATLKNIPHRPYLQDVTGLTVAADKLAITKMTKMCELLGYSARIDGEATILKGHDLILRLIPETTDMRGIQQVTFHVRREPERKVLHFGLRSILRFNGNGTATWSF